MKHTVISVAAVLLAFIFGENPIVAAFAVSAFWLGREIAQAEYRYIEQSETRKREDMPWNAILKKESWTRKSILNDFLIPTFAAFLLALVII